MKYTNPLLDERDAVNAKLTKGEIIRFIGYMISLSIHTGIPLEKMWSKVSVPNSTAPCRCAAFAAITTPPGCARPARRDLRRWFHFAPSRRLYARASIRERCGATTFVSTNTGATRPSSLAASAQEPSGRVRALSSRPPATARPMESRTPTCPIETTALGGSGWGRVWRRVRFD